ncbi:MAG TPA: ASKHA domain-containing protein, partial [Anaerolineae bacterium]|nr:ASKHA domain-containing protein [Anaerolineae bacterium]
DRDVIVETLPIVSQGKEDAPPLERSFELAPPVQRYQAQVSQPSLENPLDDATSLLQALEQAGETCIKRIDYRVAQRLPAVLRAAVLRPAEWQVQASVRGDELVAVRPSGSCHERGRERQSLPLGLAVDLGTTNIATYLYALEDGALLGVYGVANPLSTYGADIITRLSHSAAAANGGSENGARLQRILVKSLNLLLEQIAETHGCSPEDVEEMVVVGNSGMHHLFLDLPAGQLIRAPYVAALRRPLEVKARDLGIEISPGGYVFMPPLVGGFVGSDLLAVALSTRIDQQPGIRLALDIGTNTELLLSIEGELFCCSTASGPALEGAALQFGCVAMPGAIDHVWLDEPGQPFGYHTIKNRKPIGICGSGIIEALAAMHRSGAMNSSGRLQADHPLVEESPDGDHRLLLAPTKRTGLGVDLTISQSDVRAVQLAKGAIRAGAETMLGMHGLRTEQIDEILIAGAFGSHIEIDSALQIGLFPPVSPQRIRQIGNAAGIGAGLMLLSTSERSAAEELSERIHYVELATDRTFTRLFALSQRFPAGEHAD